VSATAIAAPPLVQRWLDRSAASATAAARLLARCAPSERIARAGSRDVRVAAERLMPRTARDLALAAVMADGELAAIANANATGEAGDYEIAVIVDFAWRRRSVAQSLLRRLAGAMPPHTTLVAMVRSDDVAARALLRSIAPTARVATSRGELDVRMTASALTISAVAMSRCG
jgi:ribosomal protein S18 acetylase RimI-like enzyme